MSWEDEADDASILEFPEYRDAKKLHTLQKRLGFIKGAKWARETMRCKNCRFWKRGIAEFSCETKPDFGCVLFGGKE